MLRLPWQAGYRIILFLASFCLRLIGQYGIYNRSHQRSDSLSQQIFLGLIVIIDHRHVYFGRCCDVSWSLCFRDFLAARISFQCGFEYFIPCVHRYFPGCIILNRFKTCLIESIKIMMICQWNDDSLVLFACYFLCKKTGRMLMHQVIVFQKFMI